MQSDYSEVIYSEKQDVRKIKVQDASTATSLPSGPEACKCMQEEKGCVSEAGKAVQRLKADILSQPWRGMRLDGLRFS